MKICRKIIKWEEIYETKQSTPSIGAAAPHGRGGECALLSRSLEYFRKETAI